MEANEAGMQFLSDFIENHSDDDSYFYGLGKLEPMCPFIFQAVQMGGLPADPDTFFSADLFGSYPPSEYKACRQFRSASIQNPEIFSAIACATETLYKRASLSKWECSFCNEQFAHNSLIDHLVSAHATELRDYLELHSSYLSDDEQFMSGMLSKLQFDSLIPKQEIDPNPLLYQVAAPSLSPPIDDSEEEEEDKYEEDQDNIDESLSPVLQEFISHVSHSITNPDPTNFSGEPSSKAAFLDAEEIIGRICSQYNHPQPSPTPPVEPQNQPPSTPAPLDILLSISDAEFLEENKKKKQPKPQKPKHSPLISEIPPEILETTISSVASIILSSFVNTSCIQLMRPVLKNKKKEYTKKVHEEKLSKARSEERMRAQAFKEKRQSLIDSFSKLCTVHLIKQFIKNELMELKEEANNTPQTKSSQKEAPPSSLSLVMSGLAVYNSISPKNIVSLFPGAKFAVDQGGSPRIGYRFCNNKFEVVIEMESTEDANRVLSQSPIVLDNRSVVISADKPGGTEKEGKTFNIDVFGQKVCITATEHANEGDFAGRWQRHFVEMNPRILTAYPIGE